MKAVSRLMSAVSAMALSAGFAVSGAMVIQMAAVVSVEAATVSQIEVRGNRRVDAETIRNQVGIRPGQNFTNADVNEAVKRLFDTGLFADVSITQSGSTLVVQVDEYSIVNQVLFQGNRKIKDQNLAQAVQLGPRQAFSNQILESDAQAIRDAYSRIGRDETAVTAEVQDLGGGRVKGIFKIDEGARTKIANVSFEGNSAFSDRRLRDVVSTKPSNLFSFMLRNDIYDENRLRADEEALRRFYYNRGYADFRVISSTAELVDNKYIINFTVDEGPRYTFSDVTIESTVPGVDVGALQSALATRQGAVYSAANVEKSIIDLTERVAGFGYAFARVTPRGNRDFENRTISVVYSIDEGPRAYVERIEIRGNNRTRDYVIRREFDVSEGDAFNQVLIQRAKRRLDQLNFFQTVNISTVPGSQPDQVILVVDVVEKSTGEFSIGAGYTTGASASSSGGFTVEGSITERNFLGRGQFIRFSAAGGTSGRRPSTRAVTSRSTSVSRRRSRSALAASSADRLRRSYSATWSRTAFVSASVRVASAESCWSSRARRAARGFRNGARPAVEDRDGRRLLGPWRRGQPLDWAGLFRSNATADGGAVCRNRERRYTLRALPG
jgi:outer membrane protein insertion porin family